MIIKRRHTMTYLNICAILLCICVLVSSNVNAFIASNQFINLPPNPPEVWGQESIAVNKDGIYWTETDNPDGDMIYYKVDWGDGVVYAWNGPFNSGAACASLHEWNEPGVYLIKVKAMDEQGTESEWSAPFPVTVADSNPPSKPSTYFNKLTNEIHISASDSDGDRIRYGISWDNDYNVDQWTEYVNSGTEVSVPCNNHKGVVGVVACDECHLFSEWTSIQSKPRLSFLEERFPFLFNILSSFL